MTENLRIANPVYGVQPGSNDPQVTVEGADQHVGTKGMFAEKARWQIKVQGIIQIVVGATCLVSQTIVIIWGLHIYDCFWSSFFFIFHEEPVPSDAAGIWCGIMFMAAGIVGIVASKVNTRNWVMAYMVCCIFSFLFVFVVIGLAFLNITDINQLLCSHQNTLPYLFDGLMITGASFELVISVWSAILACDARYGCCRTPEPERYYNIMYNSRSGDSGQAPAEPVNTTEQPPTYSDVNVQAAAKY